MKKVFLFSIFFALYSFLLDASVYNVMDFGAINNGRDLTTIHIQNAIDKCFADGGGIVVVPKGEFLVGTLNLKSNVEFHLETGAIIKATTDLSKYQIHNEQPAGVFYTEDSHDVSITGRVRSLVRGWNLCTGIAPR